MPRAYSLDLRERVVGLVASGEPCRVVVDLFDVSVASMVKIGVTVILSVAVAACVLYSLLSAEHLASWFEGRRGRSYLIQWSTACKFNSHRVRRIYHLHAPAA
jgi:hypothetical protein